jgi:hypothetical protein
VLQLLDVTALTLLLVPFDCHYFGAMADGIGKLYALPTVGKKCLQLCGQLQCHLLAILSKSTPIAATVTNVQGL